VRDILGWAGEIEHEMLAEKTVRDGHSVDLLRTRHEQLKAEIDARDDKFNAISRSGEAMIENGHYASDEVC
jgi:spectrin beta